MKRAVWAATLILLAIGAARANSVGFGPDSCGGVPNRGLGSYSPCPQLPGPDPLFKNHRPLSHHHVSNDGTNPDPNSPDSDDDGSVGSWNTGGGDPSDIGGGNPPYTGGGDPPYTGGGDPPYTGGGDPPNTGGGDPPNTGGGDPPNTNFVFTTDDPNCGDIPAVPEPSTMSLVLVSMAGLGLMQLRKAYRR